MPLSFLVDIGSLLYALVNVFHPDWLIRSNFRLRRSDNLHKDSHQNSWIYPRVKIGEISVKRFCLHDMLRTALSTVYIT